MRAPEERVPPPTSAPVLDSGDQACGSSFARNSTPNSTRIAAWI